MERGVTRYYQLGGWGFAIRPPQDSRDLETIRKRIFIDKEGGELVLGIKKSGTCHILLTRRQAESLASNEPTPSEATEFESLSPIIFRNVGELQRKLDWLKPKSLNDVRDTSKANKSYQDDGQTGLERGQFENTRVFYRVLQNELDPAKFDLASTSWKDTVNVVSFCYNVWKRDFRGPDDRKKSPKILEIGWCEAYTPTLDRERAKAACHIMISDNQHLLNLDLPKNSEEDKKKTQDSRDTQLPQPTQRTDWKQKYERTNYEYDNHGPTQVCDQKTAAQKVRDLFQNSAKPVVLLVHDGPKGGPSAIDVLKFLQVDVSQWEYSCEDELRQPNKNPLKSLLRDVRAPPTPQPRQAQNDPRRPYDQRRRSQSPRRGEVRPRHRSPPPTPPRRLAPVYVVDVKSMYQAVLGTEDGADSVFSMTKRLQEIYDLFLPRGPNAGNESFYLVEIFRQIARRGPIDEQKDEWTLRPPTPPPSSGDDFINDVSDYGGSDDSD
ncbi:hypothetical protein R3P38DRAFT_2842456 [Favolaschia claudopus]|uniref:Uncharacterized protein n=1 Tax=Favolaschia claudopus TaxID=2862362 RepID=A0AAW0E1G3_9AGAR